jgi:hypothetical protein
MQVYICQIIYPEEKHLILFEFLQTTVQNSGTLVLLAIQNTIEYITTCHNLFTKVSIPVAGQILQTSRHKGKGGRLRPAKNSVRLPAILVSLIKGPLFVSSFSKQDPGF